MVSAGDAEKPLAAHIEVAYYEVGQYEPGTIVGRYTHATLLVLLLIPELCRC